MPADSSPQSEAASATPSSRLVDACRGRLRGRPPIWIMRQAGRYLPEYQAIRKDHSFAAMCSDPEIAVEVSLQPLRRYGFDAVIVFYDILFILEAMGAPLRFLDDGPVFDAPVTTPADVEALHDPDLESCERGVGTGAILESLKALRSELPAETALLGFAGAPFTLAAYLVEGSFRRTGDRIRRMLYEDPAMLHTLLERLSEYSADYLERQIEAGADAVQLFDTWAGLLGEAEYREFALPYQQAIFRRLAARDASSILYINGSSHLCQPMLESGARVLSLDWRHDLPAARQGWARDAVLQGNLDPATLFAPLATLKARATALLESVRGDAAHIFNLGHGISKDTPVEAVELLVRTVQEFGE